MTMVDKGENALLKGHFEEAQWALDASFYLHSSSPSKGDPHLWQRGLACFYNGHWQEGARQFECDMSANGNDIEEVIWHFLCSCGIHGFQKAYSNGFLPLCIGNTCPPVPPMQQILELYKGTISVEEVLASVTTVDGSVVKSYNDTNALPYAHFYIGLYHEARKEYLKAKKHFKIAAEFKNPDYMGKLMEMHFDLFCRRFPSDVLGVSIQSKVIHGGWQLSSGHLIGCDEDNHRVVIIRDLLKVVDAGIRSFDCGDIYTGVEELYGQLIKAHCLRGGRSDDIAIHTKLVPDLEAIQSNSVNKNYIECIIRRSLNRLGLKSLNLVQFHWWDTSIPGYVEALSILQDLLEEGVIQNIGITNFDVATTKEFIDAEIQISSMQVQFSVLDQRPKNSGLVSLCEENHIDILAYGVLAGGFLTDNWLGKNKPQKEDLTNRSLLKYLLIIEEFGGWELFQELLQTLRVVADRHSPIVIPSGAVCDVSIAMVTISYMLKQKQVRSVIIGGHNDRYFQSTIAATLLELTPTDFAEIESFLARSAGPSGAVYGLERHIEGPHGSIMKYNLNQINRGAHLEELCHRYLCLHFEGHPAEATRTGYRHSFPHDYHLHELSQLSDSYRRMFDYDKISHSSVKACGYDHSLGPCSETDIQEYCSKVESLLKEAECLDVEALSPDQLVDLRIITSQMKLELLHWKTIEMYKKDPTFYLPLNSILHLLPAWGIEVNSGDASSLSHPGVASMSLNERLLAITSRLRAIPDLLIQGHRNLTKPVRLFVETALEICDSFSTFLSNDLPLLCNAMTSGEFDFSPEIQSTAVIAAKSVKKYKLFLRDDLLPRSSASLGVGKESYEKILQYNHFIDSSDKLLALGEKHFVEVKAELEYLATEIDPLKTWQEITTNTIHLMHPTSSNLLDAYMSEIERSRNHMISHDLVSNLPPNEKIVGFSTPKFLTPFSPFGDYLNPSPFARMGCGCEDIPRIGHLMLHSIEDKNLPRAKEQQLLRGHDYTWISVVSPRESYPGHHVQALLAQDHPRVLRKYHESILFYEGWGLYAEQLAFESGFFNKDLVYQVEDTQETRTVPAAEYAKLTRLTQLHLQLWRAARIILDVKLNTGNLSFDSCRDFLHKEVMFNQGASKGEALMYALHPGYAPCHVAGFTMIMKLREKTKVKLESEGREFDLKRFHDTLLSKGSIPFELLSILLDNY